MHSLHQSYSLMNNKQFLVWGTHIISTYMYKSNEVTELQSKITSVMFYGSLFQICLLKLV